MSSVVSELETQRVIFIIFLLSIIFSTKQSQTSFLLLYCYC